MAITAAAAIVGVAGTAAGYAAVVGTVAAVATVVGVVTKSKTLMKIGAGLGVGAAAATAVGWTGAAATTAEGAAGAAAEGVKETTQATTQTAAQAANDVAAQTGSAVSNAPISAAEAAQIADTATTTGSVGQPAGGLLASQPVAEVTTPQLAKVTTDTVAPMAQTAAPAEMAQIPDIGASANSTGTTLRGIEGGSNAVYGSTANASVPGLTPNGGSSYFDSISKMWGGMTNAQGQVIGGVLKGAGSSAAAYLGQKEQFKAQTKAQIDQENRLRAARSNFTPILWRKA